jgi:hypothetical protein
MAYAIKVFIIIIPSIKTNWKHIEKLADELLRHYNINSEIGVGLWGLYDLCK